MAGKVSALVVAGQGVIGLAVELRGQAAPAFKRPRKIGSLHALGIPEDTLPGILETIWAVAKQFVGGSKIQVVAGSVGANSDVLVYQGDRSTLGSPDASMLVASGAVLVEVMAPRPYRAMGASAAVADLMLRLEHGAPARRTKDYPEALRDSGRETGPGPEVLRQLASGESNVRMGWVVEKDGQDLVLSDGQYQDHRRLAPATIKRARRCVYETPSYRWIADL